MTQIESGTNDLTNVIINQPTSDQRKRPGYYWPLALAIAWIVVDQLVKRIVESNLGPLNSGKSIELLGGQVRIIYIVNKGASFGFLKGNDVSWVFALLALVASLVIIGWYLRSGTRNGLLQLGTGMILGGIIGNLLDRIFQEGGVTDFINLPSVEIFKVFNVADMGITVGITIVIATFILQGWSLSRKLEKEKVPGDYKQEPSGQDENRPKQEVE
ncbi:MAG TPA: signal peptidase II [Chloroflexia bacterium]|nr:signal peptidase II [Chloroflexia bacterium]